MSEIRKIVRRLQATEAAELSENLTEMTQRDTASGQHEQIDPAAQLEEDITALIRRDIPPNRHRDREPVANPTSGHMNGLLQQLGGVSIEEIDRIILELQSVRDMLRGESERLSNEVARYANLNSITMTLMRSVADRLKLSKGPENGNAA
jgi:hypothetical protein